MKDRHVHRRASLLENGRKEIKPRECIYFCISPLFTTHKYPAIKADISRHILYDMYKSSRFNFLWESAATTIKLRTKAGERGAGWSIKKKEIIKQVLGDPDVTANICCKSRNLPNTGTQNYSTDLR